MTRITLLTTASCALCDQAKALLHRVSADIEIDVEQLDVASPRGRALAEQAGVVFPPGVLVDGEPFSYGRLSERKLRRRLLRAPSPTRREEPRA